MRTWPLAHCAALSLLIWLTAFAQEPDASHPCGAIYVTEQPYASQLAAVTEELPEAIAAAAEAIEAEEKLGRVLVFEDGSTEMLSETRNALAERTRAQRNAIMTRYYEAHPEMSCE